MVFDDDLLDVSFQQTPNLVRLKFLDFAPVSTKCDIVQRNYVGGGKQSQKEGMGAKGEFFIHV
jgi:hypothetical protein